MKERTSIREQLLWGLLIVVLAVVFGTALWTWQRVSYACPIQSAQMRELQADFMKEKDLFVLVDREARIRGYYPGTDTQAMVRLSRDLKTLLRSEK